MKRIIKLTESDIRRMVMETINELEEPDFGFYGDKEARETFPRIFDKPTITPSYKPFDPQEPPEGYTEEDDPNWVPSTDEECEVLPFH